MYRLTSACIALALLGTAAACGSGNPSKTQAPEPGAPTSASSIASVVCKDLLAEDGYRMRATNTHPVHTAEQAIAAAANFTAGGTGGITDTRFAEVSNPVAPKLGLGRADSYRATWIVETHHITTFSDPQSNAASPPSTTSDVAAFVDDAELVSAGAVACPVQP